MGTKTRGLSNWGQALWLILAAVILTGCVESESVFLLNPDGSGKVEHYMKFTKTAGEWSFEDPAAEMAKALIHGAEGFEAWDDVSYRLRGDIVEIRGVGYFPALQDVRMNALALSNGSALPTNLPRFDWADGVLRLRDVDEEENEGDVHFTGLLSGLNDDEKTVNATSKIILASSKNRIVLKTSGAFSEAPAFQLNEDATKAEFFYSGEAMTKALRAEKESSGEESPEPTGIYDDPRVLRALTGQDTVQATWDPGAKPLFPYHAEVQGADIKVDQGLDGGWKKLESLE